MGDKSLIEWTATVNADGSVTPGATWNPVTGCAKVSPGCAHCYAETVAARFWPSQYQPVEYDSYSVDACCPITEMRPRAFTDVMTHEDRLDQPLRWRRQRRIFVNSMSDLFHEAVDNEFIARTFAVMALAHWHTFQVLTKRPGRMRTLLDDEDFRGEVDVWISMMLDGDADEGEPAYLRASRQERRSDDARAMAPDVCGGAWPLPNVWLGVSVENQHFADERIPLLLQTPAAVRFISAEPLLGPIDLHSPVLEADSDDYLDWVIVGGESGAGARPFDLAWARAIVQQCQAAGVPVFVKQLGAVPMVTHEAWVGAGGVRLLNARNHRRVPTGFEPILLGDRKGGDPSEWPADLRVREYPHAAR